MKLAVVGWGGDSGVGRELIEAIRNLPVTAAFILPNKDKPTRQKLITVPNCMVGGIGNIPEMEKFLDQYKIDTVLTWEVPGSWEYPKIWQNRKIRWVHVVHWDWFAREHRDVWKMAAALVAPNRMCQKELLEHCGFDSVYLPVPIDTGRFSFLIRKTADHFISVYAHGGLYQRRSLGEILAAWKRMKDPPKLTIMAQRDPPELVQHDKVRNVEVLVGNVPEPRDLYEWGDVAVQMSRYEGVGVSLLEAQARGMPVIAIDAPPMDEIAPDLPVARERTEILSIMGKSLPSHVPSVDSLAQRVQSIRGTDITELSRKARTRVESQYSWAVLKNQWMEVLSGGKP